MTVAQELTRMTPEVNHALLSADGELWKGEWGAPHRKAKKPKRFESNKAIKKTEFTKNQRELINYLRQFDQVPAVEVVKKYGENVRKQAITLQKKEMLIAEKIGTKLIYTLTEKGRTIELKKLGKEQVVDFMKSVDQFVVSDMYHIMEDMSVRRVIYDELSKGNIVQLANKFPLHYRWVK